MIATYLFDGVAKVYRLALRDQGILSVRREVGGWVDRSIPHGSGTSLLVSCVLIVLALVTWNLVNTKSWLLFFVNSHWDALVYFYPSLILISASPPYPLHLETVLMHVFSLSFPSLLSTPS